MSKKVLLLDCSFGISGDMTVGALLDLGADVAALSRALDSIKGGDFGYKISRVKKSSIDCQDFAVILDEEHENHDHDMEYLFGHQNESHHEHEEHQHDDHHHHDAHHGHDSHSHDAHGHLHHEHRNLEDVNQIIDRADMSEGARAFAKKIFLVLAQAEAKAHGHPLEQVHFHEVGAIDSIADVIAIAVCYDSLGIEKVYVRSLCEGQGTVRCQHGILSVPVPAVANIASEYGFKFSFIPVNGEFVTPTGAAFLGAAGAVFKTPSAFTLEKTGIGSGKRTYERPSMLRAFLGTEDSLDSEASVYKLESNIDDSTGEQLGYVLDRLFAAGAYDVHYVPCMMKKNRPGYVLNVICSEELIPALEQIIFEDTTTIGIRHIECGRSALERSVRKVQTELGQAFVKEVILPDGKKRCYPEYQSVVDLCKETGKSYHEVFALVSQACSREG